MEEPVCFTLPVRNLADREARITAARKISEPFDRLCYQYFSTDGSIDGLFSNRLLATANRLLSTI